MFIRILCETQFWFFLAFHKNDHMQNQRIEFLYYCVRKTTTCRPTYQRFELFSIMSQKRSYEPEFDLEALCRDELNSPAFQTRASSSIAVGNNQSNGLPTQYAIFIAVYAIAHRKSIPCSGFELFLTQYL